MKHRDLLSFGSSKSRFRHVSAARYHSRDNDLIPNDVVRHVLANDVPPARAWREHLGLTQNAVAARLGISQSAYAQQENSPRLRKASREKIAAALDITAAQLDF